MVIPTLPGGRSGFNVYIVNIVSGRGEVILIESFPGAEPSSEYELESHRRESRGSNPTSANGSNHKSQEHREQVDNITLKPTQGGNDRYRHTGKEDMII